MAVLISKPRVELVIDFQVNETEARALDALAGYGDDEFIKAFYEKLGKSYMIKHESGLRSFLKSIREFVPREIAKVDEARRSLADVDRQR